MPPTLMAPIGTMLQKGHSSYQKYHLIKMTYHKNCISQKWHIKTYIIGFLKYYQHPAIEPTHTIRQKIEKHEFGNVW